MNWNMRIDYFYPLEEENLSLFAPPGEVRLAAQSYNVALSLYLDGQEDEALNRLEQISTDYPLFPQASHLYGVLLAANGDFERAFNLLERVYLLDIDDEERAHLEEELVQARHEAIQRQRSRQKQAKREEMLLSVKKEVARESILHKVSSDDDQEIDSASHKSALVLDDPQEKQKTAHVAIIALSLAILILLLFFFLWRPQIIKEQERRMIQKEKLSWLETELGERAVNSEELARFYADYQAWQLAGRPEADDTP